MFNVYVRIPEYYSYDIENNGDIMHEDRDVTSKMYGNLRAITPNSFIGKKLKTEICEIEANYIQIDTYLEGLNA